MVYIQKFQVTHALTSTVLLTNQKSVLNETLSLKRYFCLRVRQSFFSSFITTNGYEDLSLNFLGCVLSLRSICV